MERDKIDKTKRDNTTVHTKVDIYEYEFKYKYKD